MALSKKTSDKGTQEKGQTIFAYGFDGAEFTCPSNPVDVVGVGTIRFVKLQDCDKLDDADGVIVPSGIFERFKYSSSYGTRTCRVEVNRDLLMERERQILNLVKVGKWVCFLVTEVNDHPDSYSDAFDTDLCKLALNTLGVSRQAIPDGLQASDSLCPEFAEYIRDYAVAKTVFFDLPESVEHSVIARHNSNAVAFEAGRKLFFLPFHTTLADHKSLSDIISVVATAVSNYRHNRREDIPEWADTFEFAEEATLKQERDGLKARFRVISEQIHSWRINKSILLSSGDALRDRLIIILRDYFGLKIDPLDEHREDAKVIDDKWQTLVLLEFKAMSYGVKRDDVGQINYHRDGAGLDGDTPGVLIANCNRKTTSIAERLGAEIDGKQIQYAKNQNVLIIRTIDLLCLMKQVESKGIPERKAEIMRLFTSGGGWLKASQTTCEIVTK